MTNVDELAQRIADLIGGEIVKDHDQHSRRIVADGVVVVVIKAGGGHGESLLQRD